MKNVDDIYDALIKLTGRFEPSYFEDRLENMKTVSDLTYRLVWELYEMCRYSDSKDMKEREIGKEADKTLQSIKEIVESI